MLSRRAPNTARPERSQPKPRAGWQKQEDSIEAAIPGGKKTPGSGCSRRASRKSDVIGHFARAEGKSTGKKSIRIERAFLQKITSEALPDRIPVFVFGFDGDDWGAVRLADMRVLLSLASMALEGRTDLELARRLIS